MKAELKAKFQFYINYVTISVEFNQLFFDIGIFK